MGFLHPELLLLFVPAAWVWWRTRDAVRGTQVVRFGVLALLLVALAAPYVRTRADGRDLVVVVDRSRSMPAGAGERARELIRLAEDARQPGDRVGVVSFGARASIERLPDARERFDGFERAVEPDGSNLAGALDAALQLIPEGRQGSLFVLSDGELDGRDPVEPARRAFARGVRVDVRSLARPPAPDLSVERLDLPERVDVGELFQFSVWVHCDAPTEASFVLRRKGVAISRGTRALQAGRNRLLFRDVLTVAGVADYTIELEHEGDRVPENDRGLGAVVARGTRPLLVLNNDGQEDTLVRALRRSGMLVEVRAPEELRLDPLSMLAWRGVVLENVSAPRIGSNGMEVLADYVLERGGGLLMTGGRGSFGVGGYHLTPVDELLPVSMEVRQEHRKQGVALVIVLDRSGSMGAHVDPRTTKMDLANLGSVAAIELLSAIDAVGVIAVDSTDHVIQPLTDVDDPAELASRVRTIRAGGGGIFVYTGLLAAGRMLEGVSHSNRHIILFADAADAEEQQRVPELVEALGEMGTTVSVIALGTEQDPDAAFLRTVAAKGGGEIYFTTQAMELPKLFAQDTLTVARSTFIEEPTGVGLLPDLFGLGEIGEESFPTIEGYNLNYLRDGAVLGAATLDEYRAPIVAFWHRGLGRSAVYGGQIGGSFGSSVTAWPGFATFFVTLARWLVGTEEPSALYPTVRRSGSEAIVSVEVDAEAEVPPDTSGLVARLRHPDGSYVEHLLERSGENRFETRVPLTRAGVTLGTLRLPDGRYENLAPIVLPYSPEFERASDPREGERALRALARETGGQVEPPAHTLLRGPRRARAFRVVSRDLVLIALSLLVLEIAARRLALWGMLSRTSPRQWPAARKKARAAAKRSDPGAAQELDVEPVPHSGKAGARPRPREVGSVSSALERARRTAGRKLNR